MEMLENEKKIQETIAEIFPFLYQEKKKRKKSRK